MYSEVNDMGKQRKYTPEFKIKIAKMCVEENKAAQAIAKKYDISHSVVMRWRDWYTDFGESRFYEKHRGTKSGNPYAALHTSKHLTEEERLKLENLKLRIENERLKKGYMVKGVGASKEFVTILDVNMKSLKN